jgi:FtsP/CotA-like multicopper oxidase with cupredoxin domain
MYTITNKPETVVYHLDASEFAWELSDKKVITAWGFNKQLPGPVLRANVGDTLVVKVKNDLREPTTVHWHGIRLPAAMDGTEDVQKKIEPGETFEYRFQLPDAGTFWYHAHTNETVQMERGLYGALIVDGHSEPVVDDEKIFLIDDMKLNQRNEFKMPRWFLPRMIERHDGRQGSTLLLNGKETPEINLHGNQVERWRMINASSARYFHLSFEGKPFRIIATDGGLLEQPVLATAALITPGERIDILVGPFNEGESFNLESLAYDRTTFLKARDEVFAKVKVGVRKSTTVFIPAIMNTILPLAARDAKATREIKLSVDIRIRKGDFRINDGSHLIDDPVKVGDLQIWNVRNESKMDHPFHLHGFFFQILEINGQPPEYRAWKDTCNVPPLATVKIAWMPDNRPGMWMYHCHIIEHHAAGMMASFEVTNNHSKTKIKHVHPH